MARFLSLIRRTIVTKWEKIENLENILGPARWDQAEEDGESTDKLNQNEYGMTNEEENFKDKWDEYLSEYQSSFPYTPQMLEYKLDDDLDANQLRTQVKQQPINESFNYYQGFQLQQLFFFEHKEIFCVKLLGKVIETTTKRGSFKGIITKTSKWLTRITTRLEPGILSFYNQSRNPGHEYKYCLLAQAKDDEGKLYKIEINAIKMIENQCKDKAIEVHNGDNVISSLHIPLTSSSQIVLHDPKSHVKLFDYNFKPREIKINPENSSFACNKFSI